MQLDKPLAYGRTGLLYHRVEGITMWSSLQASPWRTLEYARTLAELHAQMHGVTVPADSQPQPPGQRDRLVEKLHDAEGLSEGLLQAALNRLENLPAGDRLCHGDFHPGNVLLTSAEPIIIEPLFSAQAGRRSRVPPLDAGSGRGANVGENYRAA